MFVKIVPFSPTPESTVVQVNGPVRFGDWVSHEPPAHRDVADELDLDYAEVTEVGVDEEPSGHDSDGDFWAYRYAWWVERNTTRVVVTSGDLFVLNDQGSTIDRVRRP